MIWQKERKTFRWTRLSHHKTDDNYCGVKNKRIFLSIKLCWLWSFTSTHFLNGKSFFTRRWILRTTALIFGGSADYQRIIRKGDQRVQIILIKSLTFQSSHLAMYRQNSGRGRVEGFDFSLEGRVGNYSWFFQSPAIKLHGGLYGASTTLHDGLFSLNDIKPHSPPKTENYEWSASETLNKPITI